MASAPHCSQQLLGLSPVQPLEPMGQFYVVRSEVTAGLGEGDQGGDVALEGLSGQEKPLAIEETPLNFVAADVPFVPFIAHCLVIALGER